MVRATVGAFGCLTGGAAAGFCSFTLRRVAVFAGALGAVFGAIGFGATAFGAAFFGTIFFGAAGFGATFFGTIFFAAAGFGASFFAAAFFGAAFLGASFFAAAFFGAAFLGAGFFAAAFFGATFFGAGAAFFAAAFAFVGGATFFLAGFAAFSAFGAAFFLAGLALAGATFFAVFFTLLVFLSRLDAAFFAIEKPPSLSRAVFRPARSIIAKGRVFIAPFGRRIFASASAGPLAGARGRSAPRPQPRDDLGRGVDVAVASALAPHVGHVEPHPLE
ncbi:MAG: hypothetical protein ABFD84_17275, partial [Candidatus Polarisedimenticolia bacterium]